MSEVVRELIKRSLDTADYTHYYSHDFCCDNCGQYQHIYILKGRELTGLSVDCSKCGCDTRFRKYREVYRGEPVDVDSILKGNA
jgi:hypothetical protein